MRGNAGRAGNEIGPAEEGTIAECVGGADSFFAPQEGSRKYRHLEVESEAAMYNMRADLQIAARQRFLWRELKQ